ncbi:hypothetical protein EV44_g1921 [Erysiphe necator]|uniref:Uncharacterized protein n=1 Tax=Uncinula necator TaxID=52586 RepID=A0A0B1PFE3_UNCNE|nr:hypothetical protein EV44_g1921 [Erysiphe necator]
MNHVQENFSSGRSVQTSRPDLKLISPLTEKRKPVTTPEERDQDLSFSSRKEINDRTPRSPSKAGNPEVHQNDSLEEKNQNFINRGVLVDTSNCPPINTDFDQKLRLFKGFWKVPDRYILIPSDQKNLLSSQDSWFQLETNYSNLYANIPATVSENLISHLDQKLNPEGFQKDHRSFEALKANDYSPLWSNYSKRAQYIPSYFFRIPDDQIALLDETNSWFRGESDPSNRYARIPVEVSQNLISFLSSSFKIEEHSQKPTEENANTISESLDGNHESSRHDDSDHSEISNSIYVQQNRGPGPELNLTDKYQESSRHDDSDHSEISNSIYVQQNRGPGPELNLTDKYQESSRHDDSDHSEISNSIYVQQNCGPRPELNLIDKDQEKCNRDANSMSKSSSSIDEQKSCEPEKNPNFLDLDRASQNKDENPQLIISRQIEEEDEDFENNSLTSGPLSFSASNHDSFSDVSQVSKIFHSSNLPCTRVESYLNNPNVKDILNQSFYTKFKSIYPEYCGSIRDFTWALVYIEWLIPQDENLDWEYWDDFVRVLASEYTNNIRIYGDPITGLAYYKMEPRQALFCQNIISPKTLHIGLSSLNKDEVNYFRDAFRKEPKEPAQSHNTAQSTKPNEPQKSLSQELCEARKTTVDLMKPTEFIERSKLNNDEFRKEKSPNYISHEMPDNCPQKIHLNSWRQFLRKRKLAGTLSTINVDKVVQRRYCTTQRKEHNDPIV